MQKETVSYHEDDSTGLTRAAHIERHERHPMDFEAQIYFEFCCRDDSDGSWIHCAVHGDLFCREVKHECRRKAETARRKSKRHARYSGRV